MLFFLLRLLLRERDRTAVCPRCEQEWNGRRQFDNPEGCPKCGQWIQHREPTQRSIPVGQRVTSRRG